MRTSLYALLFLTLSLVSYSSEAGFEVGKHYV